MLMFIKAIVTFSMLEVILNKNAFHHVLTISLIFLGLPGLFIVCVSVQNTSVKDSVAVFATQPGPCHSSLAAHTALRAVNVW